MYEEILKFNQSQAENVIERFKNELLQTEQRALESYAKNYGPSGLADEIIEIANNYITLTESIGYPPERVVAQALEQARNTWGSVLNETVLFVIEYVEYVDSDSAREYTSKKRDDQEQTYSDVFNEITEEWNKIIEALEKWDREHPDEPPTGEDGEGPEPPKPEPEPEPENPFPEPKPEPEKPPKRPQKDIIEEYKRVRANLFKQVNRRVKAGVDMSDITIPAIPQRITEGSINRLKNVISRIQDEYRSLSGRGYRGQKR